MLFVKILYDYPVFLEPHSLIPFRLSHIQDYNRFIAVDLGFYRVRAAIYDVSEGSLQCIGFSSVRQSRKSFSQDGIADISGVCQTIEQAILQAGRALEEIPSDIIINFPSHSFVSDTLSTQYIRADKDSTLTMQELDSMIKLIERQSSERAKTKSKRQFGSINDDLRLVSSTIVSVMIDGKKISNPIGFMGSRVKLTVLNVFVPSSEFNIIRSVVSNLGKRAISIIPSPLILPKCIEETEYHNNNLCIIDIGYAHSTVTLLKRGEILGFETFAYGTSNILDELSDVDRHTSLLQLENILCSDTSIQKEPYHTVLDDALSYLQDMIVGYLKSEHIDISMDAIFLHGSIFSNPYILHQFKNIMSQVFTHDIQILLPQSDDGSPDGAMTY